MQRDRVAQVGHPLRAGRLLHGRADQVHRPGGDVVITTSIPSLRAIEIAFGIAVAFQVTFSSGTSSRRPIGRGAQERELHAAPAVLLVGDPPAARADVAGAMDPRLRRERQVGVLVHPLRIVRRENVRLDPERREMARELQRALDAAAARGRKVEGDEEELHSR